MCVEKGEKIVYNANGVEFDIYRVTKLTQKGPKIYYLLADYSTGHRRLLNHVSGKAAKMRADKIGDLLIKG